MFSSTVLSKIGYTKTQKKSKMVNLEIQQQGSDICLNNSHQPPQSLYQQQNLYNQSGDTRSVAPPLPERQQRELYSYGSSGGRGDVSLPGATSLHTHSAKFPIEREVILTSCEKESAKIPILTEYMRKAKTAAAVAPDAPNIHIAWAKSMENLASSSVVMSHEMASHQVYKAEPMALVDSSQVSSEPSPIRPDHSNIYSDTNGGLATSTPETENSKGGFPSRTYHSIKDMISSRFSSNKEKQQPPVENNNTTLSPQSQLRQHGVYMGPATSSSSSQDLRGSGRRNENGFSKGNFPPHNQPVESVYQTPTSTYRQPPHHHHQQHHQPQIHQQPHHQQDNMMTPALYKQQPRTIEQNYNMSRNSYVQDDSQPQWHHHQAEITHHQHHQVRYNGYPPQGTPQPHPMNRISYNGTPGPSRFDQPMHHHPPHPQHYSPVMRGQPNPHRSPRAVHQPPQGRPPPAPYQQKPPQDKDRQSPGQNFTQNDGRQSPTIYQLGKPPSETPPPSQIHQLVKQPTEIKNSPLLDKRLEAASTSQPDPSDRLPTPTSSTSAPLTSQEEPPKTLKRSQSNSQDALDSGQSSQLSDTVINNSTKADIQQVHEPPTNLPENTTSSNSDKHDKKTEASNIQRLSKLNLDHEDDDEGGFVKAGVQTDSGRGSTIYSSTKTKPSPEPGPANGGVGEWADLVESELRNILGPGNAGGNSTLSESISSVSPPLPPLSPTQSSEELNFRNRKTYGSKGASSSGWRSKGQHRSQHNSVKTSRNGVSSSLEIDSMLDENNSSEDDLDYTDVRAIRKQLEGLETMYSQVLKLLGVKKRGGSRYEPSENRIHKRRICGSMSSLPSSVSSRPIRDRRKELRHKVRDIKGINKRFQRLESHVVTLARSVAHLSSEMRTQHLMMQELEVIRSELASLRLLQQATRNTSPAKPTPDKVKKLTKFFGDEPPLLRLFLKQLGYEKYAPMFEKERIGLVELPYMSEERLVKLGIPLGPRLRIMQQAQFALATQHPNTLCIV